MGVRLALPREMLVGAGTSGQVGDLLKSFGLSKPLVMPQSARL